MKKRLAILVCVLGLTLLSTGAAFALTLNFSNSLDAKVDIFGDTLAFITPSATPGINFQITGSDGFGDTIGLRGEITNPNSGFYDIGTITIAGGVQSAPLTGSGQISIYDGVSHYFTAYVDWVKILQVGTGNTLNVEGVVNLSDFSYSGGNTDLGAFASLPAGIGVLTFQYTSGLSLSDATTNGSHNAVSFSGAMSAVPIPPSVLLLGTGLLGLVGLGWRRARKES